MDALSLNAPNDGILEKTVSQLLQDFKAMKKENAELAEIHMTEMAELKMKIAKLEDDNQDLKYHMASQQTSYAFHAVLGYDRTFEHFSTIIFDIEVTDEGNSYNPALGTYRCPVSGIYFFTVTFQSRTDRSSARIVINGSPRQVGPLTSQFTGGQKYESGASTQTATIRCNAGEDVYVQAVQHYSGYPAAHLAADESTFSGFLLSPA